MTDVVARQREPKEQQQQQQGSGQGEGKPIGAHNHNQSDQQSNGLVEQRQHSSADQGRIRQQEDKIIEEVSSVRSVSFSRVFSRKMNLSN